MENFSPNCTPRPGGVGNGHWGWGRYRARGRDAGLERRVMEHVDVAVRGSSHCPRSDGSRARSSGRADREFTLINRPNQETFSLPCYKDTGSLCCLYLRMSPNPWPNLKGIHIFVIDDNEDSRRLLEQALTYCGALVTVFQSAVAALEAMDEYLPTLLISDISMPEMTGLEFVRHLRGRRPKKGGLIPAIAITAYYEDFAAPSARAAGFDAYLPKPMNFVTSCILVEHLAGLTRPADQPAA